MYDAVELERPDQVFHLGDYVTDAEDLANAFGGLDMTANNYKNKSYTMPEHGDEMPITLADHVDKGELGLKSGKGFYDYSK